MNQSACLIVIGFTLIASLVGGAPLQERKPEQAAVEPFGRTSIVERFEGQKRASAIVVGDGQTYLGIYVFDQWGNCVAKDDSSGSLAARDDLAVEWFPPEISTYTIDVCNFGRSTNTVTIVIR